MPKQRSEAQRAAARRNGSKSRGPVTPEGKAVSSRNALKHGILAKTLLLPNESRAQFAHLCNELDQEHRPHTSQEHTYVQRMAIAQWRLLRCLNYERIAMLQHATGAKVPEIVIGDAVWVEPSARECAAFHAVHGRGKSGSSVVQLAEIRYLRQYTQAVTDLRKYRQLNPPGPTQENALLSAEPTRDPYDSSHLLPE